MLQGWWFSSCSTGRSWPKALLHKVVWKENNMRKGTAYIYFRVLLLICLAFAVNPLPAEARGDVRKRDTNGDGKIDQIAHLDGRGGIIKLEIDSNADGLMDRFQFYEKEKVIRMERDSDHNGKTDSWDYFENEKRVKHERRSEDTGQVERRILFDGEERPLKIEKDSTGDGDLDTVHHFKQGKLAYTTKDTDGDGRANLHQAYRDEKPLERKIDGDGDGRWDRLTLYDEEGLARESRHDLDADGWMEVSRFYRKGSLVEQKKDADRDGRFEEVTRFEKDVLGI